MIIDPKHVPQLEVCRGCRDVVGPFSVGTADPDHSQHLVQRGSCPRHRPSGPEPGWPRYDFNRQVDLCYCCGIVPLSSGSRWSVWFCAACKAQVGLLNARHGRCIVPIGRHSVHWGYLLRGHQLDDTLAVEGFLAFSGIQGRVTGILRDWSHEAVERNLEAIGAGDRPSVPLEAYCREARIHVDPLDRFRDMCAHLDDRGRSELTEEGAGSA